jgi:hypothetical protein
MGAGIANMFYPVMPGKDVPQVILAASLAIIIDKLYYYEFQIFIGTK